MRLRKCNPPPPLTDVYDMTKKVILKPKIEVWFKALRPSLSPEFCAKKVKKFQFQTFSLLVLNFRE